MCHLTQVQKQFTVQRLACYCTLADVCDQLKEQFGVTASTAQIARYKPGTIAGAGLSKPLLNAFHAARREFQSDNSEMPLLDKTYRIRELHWLYQQVKHKDPFAAARLLEQAAKESGGFFTRSSDSDAPDPADNVSEAMQRQIDQLYARKKAESNLTSPVVPGTKPLAPSP